ncbi:MAG: glutamate--tRNA ligase [Candidatus Manganitrophaceae bacterium]|nr:MAG: glutamate--tRNA ligase [Candidatus Manganitrophaceae bacterium]
MSDVRVRFAPSPTGYLHIGGARTALFNWLFARHHGGKFFLRIEDTDRSRSTDEAIDAIIDGMRWLGLDWDQWEGSDKNPIRQTDRFDLYRQKVQELLDRGLAYRCYCTAEELEARRKEAMAHGKIPRYDGRCRQLTAPVAGKEAAIRFKASSEGEIVIDDMVKGKVVFDASTVDDLIILRSDGTPTYNFCVVVDDVDMQISHVIRGDDHLNNTPRQIQMYQALGYPLPRFGHVSMILGPDKARLSKRHGATAIQQYREEGYLPEAMVNYLVRLGWSHKDQEIFSLPELIEKFSMEQVGASAAVFNPEKLLWLNAHYIKTGDPKRLAQLLLPHLERLGVPAGAVDLARLEQIVVALRERTRTLKEMAESAVYFFVDEIAMDEKAQKLLTPEALPILKAVRDRLAETPFEHAPLEEAFRSVSEALGLKLAQIAQPVRAAVTGKTVSPGIFDVLMILGRERALKRLDNQIAPRSSPAAEK